MKQMMLITSSWKNGRTFKMIPTTDDCPYVECIFDPQLKILAVIGKNKKETFHMVPRLDANGDPELRKSPKSPDKIAKEERRTLETYQEYYLEEVSEVGKFVEHFAVNADTFDYKQYLNATPVSAE